MRCAIISLVRAGYGRKDVDGELVRVRIVDGKLDG
jgi:hypothetical protein